MVSPIASTQQRKVTRQGVSGGPMTISGPEGLGQIKGFHDEALRGEWKGHRSSRLGKQYRVIYKIANQQLCVQVINLTGHDYRRK